MEMGERMGILNGKNVLLVEDEPIVSMLVEDMLAGLGAQVIGPAAHLGQAVELAQNARFDVAVLDMKLGSDSSEKVAEVLQERAIPYVLATGFDSPPPGCGNRAAPLLQKPYLQDDLARALEQALEAHSPTKQPAHA